MDVRIGEEIIFVTFIDMKDRYTTIIHIKIRYEVLELIETKLNIFRHDFGKIREKLALTVPIRLESKCMTSYTGWQNGWRKPLLSSPPTGCSFPNRNGKTRLLR